MPASTRTASIERRTGETSIELTLNIDGSGMVDSATGIGFLDHMLHLFARHGLFDLKVHASGDLHVDEHHTAEDVCICLGQAFDRALGERRGLVRTAHAYVPMDEALGFVAVDLSGRPYCVVDADFVTPRVGQLGTDLIAHLFESIAIHGRMNLHARVLYGRNDHHKVEALFKALGRALDMATRIDERLGGAIPSTKGVL
ncbi:MULTISPECIES: imidazoleglycerol-phosphate dehydratase HisB [unclassified Roseiflexus]|uniref:Imidazoleglycerol-phosphate dehydratase n=1 Tax=Roseiflexus sp. (strain RS-1) TaxID=357808 RepID=HIS7_ROSS1|nr:MULTISPECIES: imidazoleglycerol-phosphate dehydratase HisB [unclassified Roseiflexus]A5USC4.1 RecName: Full=Imidazoleglycerol-phosphate dehydratase; Short=IGPD [Roseiflexus sp. RS-1]ABQ89527.1 Imidazoleglycerol-phosphate dehydratase [Roseiflexus sp. RS-1]MBO9320630.1 imidazoleglycerol-phosphate dehydratase HisB [Roseiflexus sp.]MBO9343191.1 imidazoleglycerol-phosphate dehydratase HisB [Roseiflexus sp.]MCL6540725.1 imidazoleglycerol-phosphate dehydratase HisB [Roseiflexus sp.]